MEKLSPDMLYSLEQYSRLRNDFRAKVMAHKKNRQVALGPNATLHFEDHLTIHYQVQEILRAERIFEAEEIEGELAAYNPLIPDGGNWKATLMFEYPDVEQRKNALAKMANIEDRVWVKVDGFERVWGIADEDLDRSTEQKTSSVHFLRFELTPAMIAAAKAGAALSMGIEHPAYCHQVDPVPEHVRKSLVLDLD
ncbi:MAG: DUF3501 family protein [Pseudomonadota bacterium]